MSRIDEIWEAYYKGQAAAENDDVLSMGVHSVFGHIMAAMVPGGDEDEELAFEKGYHGDELQLCYECEHVQENCECEDNENSYSESDSSKKYDADDRNSDSDSYSGGGGGGGGSSSGGGGGGSYDSGSSSGSSGCGGVILAIGALFVVGLVCAGFIKGPEFLTNWRNQSDTTGGTSSDGKRSTGGTANRRTTKLANGTSVLDKDSNGFGGIMYVNIKTLNVRSGPGQKYKIVRKAYLGDRILVYGQPETVDGEQWSVSIAENPETRGWVNLKFISANEPSKSYSFNQPNVEESPSTPAQNPGNSSIPLATPERRPTQSANPQKRFEELATRAGYRNLGNGIYEDIKTQKRYTLELSHDGNGVVGTEIRSQTREK